MSNGTPDPSHAGGFVTAPGIDGAASGAAASGIQIKAAVQTAAFHRRGRSSHETFDIKDSHNREPIEATATRAVAFTLTRYLASCIAAMTKCRNQKAGNATILWRQSFDSAPILSMTTVECHRREHCRD
jgi:hypothetical protein